MVVTPERGPPAPCMPLAAIDRLSSPARKAAAAAPATKRTVVLLSHLGRGGLLWFALAPVVGAGSQRLGRLQATAISSAAIGSALLLSTALARALARPRPCERGARSLIPCPAGGSCPSDQAAAVFAAAEILGWFEPRLRTPLAVSGTAIAIARVAAGVHYPTDVAAGGVLGLVIGRAARAEAKLRGRQASAPVRQ